MELIPMAITFALAVYFIIKTELDTRFDKAASEWDAKLEQAIEDMKNG